MALTEIVVLFLVGMTFIGTSAVIVEPGNVSPSTLVTITSGVYNLVIIPQDPNKNSHENCNIPSGNQYLDVRGEMATGSIPGQTALFSHGGCVV